MKFTKFIPVALMCTLAVPAFADPVTLQNNYDLTIPSYFTITEKAGTVKTGTGVIADDGAGNLSLTYPTAMKVTYRVINNNEAKPFYVKATAGTTAYNALNGTSPAGLKIALANTTVAPTSDAVSNAIGASPAEDQNSNVIALTFTPTKSTLIGDTELADPTFSSNKLVYSAEPGTYEVTYTFGTSAVAGTFSSRDTQGTYRAVVTITESDA